MTPQELKNSILQLAIQGKLVEQRPEEGTGEELYQQIRAEKERLIKAGKMKKGKPLPQITEVDNPFDIPASWKWVRISELGEVTGGGTPRTQNADYWDDARIPWLTPADMKFITGKYAERGKRNISALGLENSSARLMPKGTVLYSSRAPIGYIAIAANDISTNQGFKSLVPAVMDINEYIYYCLMARTSDIVSRSSGTTFKEISGTDFGLTIVPLPPLAEQKRIVAKIEELLPHIDRYEKAWSKLEDFNERFPSDMQKSILQMAIQGKLVEQRPAEGTGENLYQQIQAEKQRLIKAGTIEKPLPEITEDEKPFNIPESWKWVKFGSLAIIQSSKRVFEKDYVGDGIPFFRSKEIGDLSRGEAIRTELFISKEHYLKLRKSVGVPQPGDILITSVGTIGNTWICDGREFYFKDGNITQVCSNEHFDFRYAEHFIHSPLFNAQARSTIAGTAYSALTIKKLKNILFPLPPLAEQKRIVAKLEEILPLCDRLKS